MTFEDLLHPCKPVIFFDRYWEREPLIIQNRDFAPFVNLLSIEDIDELLTSRWLQSPAVRLIKDGKELSLSAYTKNVGWGGHSFNNVIDVEQVVRAY